MGTTYVGNVGTWTGTGTVTYELLWQSCNPYKADDCRQLAATSTTDPHSTLSYTPTAADNFSEWHLIYSVTATDSTGASTWDQYVGRAHPSRRWYEGLSAEIRQQDTAAAIDHDGVATVVGMWTKGDVWGLYAQRMKVGEPVGALELVYRSSHPQNNPTSELAVEVDNSGRVHLAFLDQDGNLMVTERDPGSGAWATPTRLASAGTFDLSTFRTADGQSLLVTAPNGRAAVAWASGADADDPAEIHIATRGLSGWTDASVHVVDQPKYIHCDEGVTGVTIGAPTDAKLGIDGDGDVTVVWHRSEQTCPGDPYQAYQRLEAAYLRDGSWTSASQIARTPGYAGFGDYFPVAMRTSQAGTALALTHGTFEGDTSNRRTSLLLLTAPAGATFGTIDPATGAPATTLRRWADNGDISDDGAPNAFDIALSENGKLHVGWTASGTGVPQTLEIASGTLMGGLGPKSTVASRANELGSILSPQLAVDETGDAAVVFGGVVIGDAGSRGYFAIHDPAGGWSAPQTLDTISTGAPRWLSGAQQVIRFDDHHRLNLVRNGSYGSSRPPTITRLAAGSAPPEVEVPEGHEVKQASPVTIAPLSAVDPDGGTLSYAWDLDGDGQYDDATTREVTKTYDVAGRHPLALRVTAQDGDIDIDTGWLDVVENQPPTIYALTWDEQPVAGQPTSFTAHVGDDFDQEAQLRYEWIFDGTLDATQTGVTASHTFPAGWRTVKVTVTDTDGSTSSMERNVYVEVGTAPNPALTVTKEGTGSGNVSGDGIHCGLDCAQSFPSGSDVTLTAEADAGSVFEGWHGCTSVTAEGACRVTMSEDKEVSARFDVAATTQRRLTVQLSGLGSGTVLGTGIDCGSDCVETVTQGSQVHLTAVPGSSSKLKGWTDCPMVVDGGVGCLVTLHDDQSVGAKFVPRFGVVDTDITFTKVNSRKRRATVGFTGSSPAGINHFECKVDESSWATCTSSIVLRRLSPGSHTFLVRTVDEDGITDKTPAEITVRIVRR